MSETLAIEHIPTHLIAGPLGSGKTTLLKQLLQQRPEHERWAILINEFGQVGIDAALLQADASGVQLAEIPGGCLCCVNGVPFQVGLGRLLRRARPQRLFIEASGLGHPHALMQQLAAEPWKGVLALQPLVMVLDAPRRLAGEPLADAQQQSLATAGLVILNKAEELTPADCQQLIMQLLPVPALCSSQAALCLADLPRVAAPDKPIGSLSIPSNAQPAGTLWRDTSDWHCHVQELDDQHSIGWKIHPAQVFALGALIDWLGQFRWLRAKGVVHTDEGWLAFNALPDENIVWSASEWRRDSRLELISSFPPEPQLESGLRATIITPPNLPQSESQ